MSTTTPTFVRNELARNFVDIPRYIRGTSKLPKDVIIHYLLDDGSVGPRPNGFLSRDLLEEHEEVYVYHITEIDSEDLYGRKVVRGAASKVDREYFSKYRNFSRVHNLDRILQRKQHPLFINYNHIFSLYTAQHNLQIDQIYRNMGNFATLWKGVASIESDSLQLIPIRLPRLVKELRNMKILIEKPNKTNLLKYSSLNDIYLFSLMTIVCADEYSAELAERNIVFRLIDGLNHVDIPYKLIAKEIDKKGSTPSTRLTDFYDILNALIEIRVSQVEEGDTEVDLKASKITIDTTEVDVTDVEGNIAKRSKELMDQGVLSEKEVKRIEFEAKKFSQIELDGRKVGDILAESKKNKRVVPESTIPKIKAPIGESIKSNVTQRMDAEYVSTTLEQDLIENLAVLSNQGHMVLNIKKEPFRDAATDEIMYSVQTRHVNGSVGTMKFTIPNVKEDGTFRSGGVQYRMGKQRVSLPIVKIAPYEVAMTSSHSKMFATVGRTAADNLRTKVDKELGAHIIDGKITEYTEGGKLTPDTKMGLIEAAIFLSCSSLTYGKLKLDFNGEHTYKGDKVKFNKAAELVGKENYGSVLTLLDISSDRIGKSHSEIRIKGAHIPISLILGSWMGLDEFFKRIGVVTTEFDINQRVDKSKGPVLRFKDVKVQIQYRNMEQLLLINGLLKNETAFKEVQRDSLDKSAGWKLLFTVLGLGRSQERGVKAVQHAWIDTITAKLLKRQEYPTNMIDLLLVVNRLLSTAEHSREADGDLMFIRGYDRINDIIYRELMNAASDFEANSSRKKKLTMNPKAVKMAILEDGLVSPTEDTSPINQISNQTRLGYGGTGGRSDRSMVARHRVFDPNDLGVISEAGTDDGKAGTILNTSTNPNFDSIYGTSKSDKEMEIGNILSINSLVAPFALHDEMKRTLFSRIQSNSMIYAEGYRIMPTYTGAGLVAAHQVDGNYVHVSKDAGEVVRVTDKYLEIKYKDGTKAKLKLGRGMSKNSGKILPKVLITDLKPKDKFRKGAVLIWDKNYFARSMIEPDQVELYTGAPIFIAIKDEQDTYEDASAMDQQDGDTALSSNIIHTRTINVKYTEEFKLTVDLDDEVMPNTPVAIIAPEGVQITEDVASLDFMSQAVPKAQHAGRIVRIEVNYCGDPKNASRGLKKAIKASDAMFKEESEYSDVHPTGEVKEPTYINQEYLDKDSAVITIYMEHLDKYGVGDKSSDCNALKTVNGYAWSGRMETLAGLRIGGKFSGDGIFRRVVTSAFSIGILNFTQYSAGMRIADIYHGRIK